MDGGSMSEERLAKLEAIIPTLATKADLVDMKAEIVKWMVGIQFAAMAIIIGIIIGFGTVLTRYVQDSKPVATQSPPIILYPPQSPPAAPAPKP